MGNKNQGAAAMTAAKLFTLGKAQAVCIPARYRLQADEVEITEKDGALILRPKLRTAAEVFARARTIAGDAFKGLGAPGAGHVEACRASGMVSGTSGDVTTKPPSSAASKLTG